MKLTPALLAVVLLAGIPAAAEQAVNTLDTIKQTKTIRLGFLQNAFPFSFADENKEPAGFSVELCRRVAQGIKEQLGLPDLEAKWVPVTLANRFDMVRNGSIDIECGTSTNSVSRQKIVDFSLPIWVDGGNFVAKSSTKVQDLFDLDGKKVGVSAGTTTEKVLPEALERKGVKAQVVTFKDHVEGMNALHQNKIDAYAADQTVLLSLALAAGDQLQVTMGRQYFSYEPYGLVMRRTDADFRQAVNASLARLFRSGQVANIYNHWFARIGKPSDILIAAWAISGLPE